MRAYRQHRGAAYLVALLAGSIVTVAGLASLSLTTSRARTTAMADHAARARALANSGLDHARSAVAAHVDGGGTRADIFGAANPSMPLDGGDFGWSLRRMDGTAIGNTDEPIVVRAWGRHGQARYGLRATFPPSGVPYDVLDTCMYVGGTLSIGLLANLTGDKVIGAATEINVGLTATGTAPLESPGQVTGAGALTYGGATSSNAPERRLPDASLLNYYIALGERISLASLPYSGSVYMLEDVLLSPASNPFGNTNELGIYIIDLQGSERLQIRNTRSVGTLVLINTESNNVIIGSNTLMQPAFEWMPSLLVRGGVTFMGTASGPDESVLGINLNPPSTPYDLQSDEDLDDAYPGRIQGVSYITGDTTFALPRQHIRGTMIIGGNATVRTSVAINVSYDPSVATLPPFGFFDDQGGLAIDPASITWTLPD
ncbi:MAG: hypothetical protein ACIAS6_06140 [Phycisphaerales bacterium JB060]